MATKNIVPRADSEGQIGTTSKYWSYGYFDSMNTVQTFFDDGTDVHVIKAVQESGLGGRLTIGLDETARAMVLCDLGDIDVDLGLAAQDDPRLYIFKNNVAQNVSLKHDVLFFTSNARIIAQAGMNFEQNGDRAIGNNFSFISGSNQELTGNNAEQAWIYVGPKINQTSTAGYIGLLMDVTETLTGSGTNALMDLRVATASKFLIDNSGGIFPAGMKSGTDQADAGAAAGELYQDTNDDNSIKMGV